MTEQMKDALKGQGGTALSLTTAARIGGLQSVSSAVGDAIGGGIDTRGSKSKKSDEAGQSISSMGKSPGPTTEGTSIGGDQQVKNMASGNADHLGLGMRKQL
ncbi:hypothetical protein K431DRAFT_291613 [Polychaeton citri CBS 116435]|uniref:Uncharacterized protein n=1 Tax=Polychaeton citri CBS 116435 TaxID=1314669 RepID=A0A9P4QF69_9PEZI|nr:hypothetical protein K431DRAFT_291613 [Polychaeton citri CBS 116435]